MARPIRGAVDVTLSVDGLTQLRRQLRELNPELVKEMRGELRTAGEHVAADARRHIPVRTGRARDSIRVLVSGTTVYVAGGKARIPYYGWLDFGGDLKPIGKRRGVRKRPFLKNGRYLYPAIDRNKAQTVVAVKAAVDRTIHRGGLA